MNFSDVNKNIGKKVYSSSFFCWAPGVESKSEWREWQRNERAIIKEKKLPKLEFVDSLFKRRLSQLSRMTIQVIHDLLEEYPQYRNSKQVFISFRGEIERQFSINKEIIEDKEVMPAGFSLSVFNTPIATATICLKLKGGYSAIYPSPFIQYSQTENSSIKMTDKTNMTFSDAFKAASSSVLCGDEENIILVYADELVPDVYGSLRPEDNEPMAFACILSAKETVDCAKLIDIDKIQDEKKFLREYYE